MSTGKRKRGQIDRKNALSLVLLFAVLYISIGMIAVGLLTQIPNGIPVVDNIVGLMLLGAGLPLFGLTARQILKKAN